MGGKNAKPAISDADLDYIAKHTAAKKQDVKQQFEQFLIKHPDGQISKAQFKLMMQTCYPGAMTGDLEDHIFPMYDVNGDGHIDFQEFMTVLYIMSSGTHDENLEQIFRVFDTNHDDAISEDEMKRVVKNLYYLFKFNDKIDHEEDNKKSKASNGLMNQGPTEFAMKVFKEMDQNQDGKVTKEEFITACLSQNLDSENVSAKLALGIADVFVTD